MKTLLTKDQTLATIQKMARDVVQDYRRVVAERGVKPMVLVGIRTRGIPLAAQLASIIGKDLKKKITVGSLDITLYRDDLSRLAEHPIVGRTELPGSIDDQVVYLVDDVLFTGRTIRCGFDALFDLGRPAIIRLVVLVDRGGRELPIQADVVGLKYSAAALDNVKVKLMESDAAMGVEVISR